MTSGPLGPAVDQFVDAISDELAALSSRPATSFALEAAVEASNVVAGIIAADGRFTQSELDGYLDALAHRLDPPLLISSTDLRESDILVGRASDLARPSVMFDLLVRSDARAHTQRSHRYYELALRLAHVAAALDLVPSPDEIDAITRFRVTMLDHMDSLGVARQGNRCRTCRPLRLAR